MNQHNRASFQRSDTQPEVCALTSFQGFRTVALDLASNRFGAPVKRIPKSDGKEGHRLEIELWAPSRAISIVTPRAKLRRMYHAFPRAAATRAL